MTREALCGTIKVLVYSYLRYNGGKQGSDRLDNVTVFGLQYEEKVVVTDLSSCRYIS